MEVGPVASFLIHYVTSKHSSLSRRHNHLPPHSTMLRRARNAVVSMGKSLITITGLVWILTVSLSTGFFTDMALLAAVEGKLSPTSTIRAFLATSLTIVIFPIEILGGGGVLTNNSREMVLITFASLIVVMNWDILRMAVMLVVGVAGAVGFKLWQPIERLDYPKIHAMEAVFDFFRKAACTNAAALAAGVSGGVTFRLVVEMVANRSCWVRGSTNNEAKANMMVACPWMVISAASMAMVQLFRNGNDVGLKTNRGEMLLGIHAISQMVCFPYAVFLLFRVLEKEPSDGVGVSMPVMKMMVCAAILQTAVTDVRFFAGLC